MNTPDDSEASRLDALEAERTWARLWAAVEALDPEIRTFFLLHGLTGASHSEIARLIDLPERLCQERLERARARVIAAVERARS